jgi:outer membrane protein assembly factor BamA
MLASLRTFGSAVRCIALSALLLCGISTINVDAARAQGVSEAYSISSVVIQGNRRIDTDAIKSLIKASSGRVTSEQIAQDVKTLYNAGFFDQVLVSFGTGPGGTPVLIYTVKEKPVARKLFVKGNKEVSEGDLVDILKLEGRRFVDKSKVQGLVRKGVSYYQSQGFYDAEIDYTLAPVSDNEVDVTFNVKEALSGSRSDTTRGSRAGRGRDAFEDPDSTVQVVELLDIRHWPSKSGDDGG